MSWPCWLRGGHRYGVPHVNAAGALCVTCAECQRESPGILVQPAYRRTQAGDPHRQALAEIRRRYAAWRRRWAQVA